MFNEQLHGAPHWVRTINQAFLAHRNTRNTRKILTDARQALGFRVFGVFRSENF
jgi:hypothetical protein